MATLLSIDCEFSHPVPRKGNLMQMGLVAMQWNPETMLATFVEDGPGGLSMKINFPLDRNRLVTDWVKKNQAPLLEECANVDLSHEACCTRVKEFIRRAKKTYGDPVTVCGWCTGSDMAYLLDVLGEDNEMVHYSVIDVKGLAMAIMKEVDPSDKDLIKVLGLPKNENEHDALADAMYQMHLTLAAMKYINR